MRETMITVAGNVGGAPTFFEAKAGQEPKMVLSVATTRRVRDRDSGEWRDGNTSWYDVWLQGRLAQNAQRSIAKGDAVIVTGHVEIRPWEDGDKSGTKAVVSARSFGPDLSKFPVTISRVRVATQDDAADPGPDAAHGSGSAGASATSIDVTGYQVVDEAGAPTATQGGDDEDQPEDDSIASRLASGL